MSLELESPFLIKPLAGFAPTMGHLVSMIAYVRQTTLMAARELDVAALDFLLDANANSIGMLLEHMACVEKWYQADSLGVEFGPEALARMELGAELGERAREEIRGFPLEAYVERLAAVRSRTLLELATRSDEWLFEESAFWGGQLANNYFKWFHVFEDELNHRGQIRLIRQRALAAAAGA